MMWSLYIKLNKMLCVCVCVPNMHAALPAATGGCCTSVHQNKPSFRAGFRLSPASFLPLLPCDSTFPFCHGTLLFVPILKYFCFSVFFSFYLTTLSCLKVFLISFPFLLSPFYTLRIGKVKPVCPCRCD